MNRCPWWTNYRRYCFFFFQAEDGIRDLTVTGVQTCALPILMARASAKESSTLVSPDRSTAVSADAVTRRDVTMSVMPGAGPRAVRSRAATTGGAGAAAFPTAPPSGGVPARGARGRACATEK